MTTFREISAILQSLREELLFNGDEIFMNITMEQSGHAELDYLEAMNKLESAAIAFDRAGLNNTNEFSFNWRRQ